MKDDKCASSPPVRRDTIMAQRLTPQKILTNLRQYWLELTIGLIVIGLLTYALVFGLYRINGALKYDSAIFYLVCFGFTSFFLNRQGAKFLDRLFFSILSMLAGVVLFEIVYHYGFGISQAQLVSDFSFLGNSGSGFPLDWYLLIFASLFVGRKYMGLNKSLLAISAFGAVVMFLWIGSGYPQTFNPPWIANYLPIYSTFHISYSGPAMIIHYAEFYNWITKPIAVIPAFFFNKNPRLAAPK
jgi:hypothetical protein